MQLSIKLHTFLFTLSITRLDEEARRIILFDQFTQQEIKTKMNSIFLSTPTKQKTITTTPVNADGKACPIFGSIEYSVSIPGIASVFANDNGSAFDIQAIAEGTTEVTVTVTKKSGGKLVRILKVTVGPKPVPAVDPEEAVDVIFAEGPETEQ